MNISKLFISRLLAVAVLLSLFGCDVDPSERTATSAQPTAFVVEPDSSSVAKLASTGQTSSPPSAVSSELPNVKTDGMGLKVVVGVVNSVGRSRDELVKILGVPDETPPGSGDNRAFWVWNVRGVDQKLWLIQASTTNSTKLTDHVFIYPPGRINVGMWYRIFAPSPEPVPFWGGESWSDKKASVVIGRSANGKAVRAYCYSDQPFVVSNPYLNAQGVRVDRFAPNPDTPWLGGIVELIAVGTDPAMNVNVDRYLFNPKAWKELK